MKAMHHPPLALALLTLLGTALFTGPAVHAEESKASGEAPSTESHVVELPQSLGEGKDKEVSVLLDESHLKLATITLRRGTVLPTHSAPVPATIQVLDGEGVIHVGSKAVPVSKGTIVSLAAREDHDVVPAKGSDMLLLVHYLRSGPSAAAAPSTGHDH